LRPPDKTAHFSFPPSPVDKSPIASIPVRPRIAPRVGFGGHFNAFGRKGDSSFLNVASRFRKDISFFRQDDPSFWKNGSSLGQGAASFLNDEALFV
jgi:hypothetical protein